MIKIAFFFDKPISAGGIYEHCKRLKKLLEENGDYKVFLYSNIAYKKVYKYKFYSKKEIKKILKSEEFDYIHLHGFISSLPTQVLSCVKQLKLNTPIIYTPHAHPFYTLNHPFINKLFFYCYVKKVFYKASKIISINMEDSVFISGFNKNITTIPHWLDCNSNSTKKSISKNSKPILLFVGRNEPNKNLRALYSLPKGKYQVICVTNKKPFREDFIFKQNISTEELDNLYEKADLTVIPSRYEAFSYVALESLYKGTPVLLSDRVRIADFLTNIDGVTVYKYENSNDLCEKIDYAINQKVNTEAIIDIFSSERAFNMYSKNIFN